MNEQTSEQHQNYIPKTFSGNKYVEIRSFVLKILSKAKFCYIQVTPQPRFCKYQSIYKFWSTFVHLF